MILFISSYFLLLAVFIGISSDALLQSPSLPMPRTSSHSMPCRFRSANLLSPPSRKANSNNPLFLGASGERSERSGGEELKCGDGFYRQTGADGDYCVLDYDAIFAVAANSEEGAGDDNKKDEHYWDALESQNAARRKFGLPDLTPEQYVALQAENHLTAQQQIVDATAQAFSQFDTNNDGVVCVNELREGLQKILRRTDHLSESQARKVMDFFDDNGDGVLHPDEFIPVGQLRERLDAVIEAEREEMMRMMSTTDQEKQQKQQKEQEQGGISLIGSFFNMFVDTCETNFDCDRPEVCCDLGYRKTCCMSGQTARQMGLEYATVPVPQNI